MMKITHSLSVDLQHSGSQNTIYAKQGDRLTREITINLFNGGSVWAAQSDVAVLQLAYCKSDKVGGCYDHMPDASVAGRFNSDRTAVTLQLHPQVLNVAGNVFCELRLLTNAGEILNTFNFIVNVQKSPIAMTLASEGYYNNVFDGATFIPHISPDGTVSWTNNKNLPNPAPVNVKGPKGDYGKSAYEFAVAGGYTGTPEQFAAESAGIASSVKYTAQNLTDEQKAQARENIDAPNFIKPMQFTEADGYFNDSGSIHAPVESQLEKYTSKITIPGSGGLKWSFNLKNDIRKPLWIAYMEYDNSLHVIGSRKTLINEIREAGDGKASGSITFSANAAFAAFCYRTYGKEVEFSVGGSVWDYDGLAKMIGKNPEINTRIDNAKDIACSALERLRPVYDHLFVNTPAAYIDIPSESLFHLKLSKRLGFDIIECNVAKTSDDVYFINHLVSGKFGHFFHHVDGTTDISQELASGKTWAWIVENVRYNSKIEKLQTRPPTLDEFLRGCRQLNMMPFITATSSDVINIANEIMGRENYIAYGATRQNCPDAIIYHWKDLTSKNEILDYCRSIGRPFIYGMSNPTAFTDTELTDIVGALHSEGFKIGCSYADDNWHNLSYFGFDFNGSCKSMNRIKNGNICNLDSVYGFTDFITTNAVEADGVLTYSADGTIKPDFSSRVFDLCGIDIEICFSGTITIPKVGEHLQAKTYSSDGSVPFFKAIPIVHGNPQLTISASSGTVISSVTFKASNFGDFDENEVVSNKVTSISAQSTDVQYPSAAAVKDYVDNIVGDIESAINEIRGVTAE